MKKKLLLIALPALMALSGCTNLERAGTVVKDFNAMQEDTLAHEEVFGGVAYKDESIRRMPVVDTDTNYKVGYQLHYDSVADELSVRFVAAIKTEYAQMRWSRGLAKGDGTEVKGFSDHRYDEGKAENVYFDSKEAYTSLSNGGEDAITAGGTGYEEFSYFIVYSLTNIPYNTYKESYLAVSLTLDPNTAVDDDEIVTETYAIKIETDSENENQSAYTFSFPNMNIGYFMAGKFGGDKKNIREEHPGRNFNSNQATFATTFTSTDEFVIVKKTDSEFKVWNSDMISGMSGHFGATTKGKRIKVTDEGGYLRIYLNRLDFSGKGGLYASASTFTKGNSTEFYLRSDYNDWNANAAYNLLSDGDDDSYGAITKELHVGEKFKIAKSDWSYSHGSKYGEGNPRVKGEAAGDFTCDLSGDNDIVCNANKTFTIVLAKDGYIYAGYPAADL